MKKAIIIILAIIVLLVGGYFAYVKFVKKESSGGGVLTKVTLNPNCKHNDPDLCKFINGWKDVKHYTYTSKDTISGKETTSVLKSEGDTKSQMMVSEGDKESFNVITIGETTYTKDYSDNKWWKYVSKPDESTILSEQKEEIDFDEAEDKTTYKKIGKEACGKLTCFKYQVIDPAMTDITQYIYFDNKDYYLRKLRTENKDGSVSEATIDYSKVKISEPSPTKEGSPLQGIVPTTTNSETDSSNNIPVEIPTEEELSTELEIPTE